MDSYYFAHIGKSGSPLLVFIGDIDFRSESFESLAVGDRINQIGSSSTGVGAGMAALNRCCFFKPYVTYVGKAKIKEFGDDDLIFFEIRDQDKPGHIKPPMYAAYQVLDYEGKLELKLWDHANNTIWVARPVFEKYNETVEI